MEECTPHWRPHSSQGLGATRWLFFQLCSGFDFGKCDDLETIAALTYCGKIQVTDL